MADILISFFEFFSAVLEFFLPSLVKYAEAIFYSLMVLKIILSSFFLCKKCKGG